MELSASALLAKQVSHSWSTKKAPVFLDPSLKTDFGSLDTRPLDFRVGTPVQRHHQHRRHHQHQQQHRHHQQPWMRICTSHIAKQNRKTDSDFVSGLLHILRAFSGFCGPCPGLRAPPTSVRSLIFMFIFSKNIKES